MTELLREYPTLVGGVDENAYVAQIWGRERDDGRWQAWLVFVPVTRGEPRRADRETTQCSREAAKYGAAGVTAAYLQGALTRSVPVRGAVGCTAGARRVQSADMADFLAVVHSGFGA